MLRSRFTYYTSSFHASRVPIHYDSATEVSVDYQVGNAFWMIWLNLFGLAFSNIFHKYLGFSLYVVIKYDLFKFFQETKFSTKNILSMLTQHCQNFKRFFIELEKSQRLKCDIYQKQLTLSSVYLSSPCLHSSFVFKSRSLF